MWNPETKIWSSPTFPSLFNPELSLGQLVLWLLERNPSKIAQISYNNNKHTTNAELRLKTVRAALNLEALGFKKGDIFAIASKNNHDTAPLVFAAFCLGCPVNAVAASFDKSELVHMFGVTKPKTVFCEAETFDVVEASLRELKNNAKIFTFESEFAGSINVNTLFRKSINETNYQATNIDPENTIAMIVCSSGTTGPPKGVCVSHAALVYDSNRLFDVNDQDVFLTFSALNWITGVCALIYCTVQGTTRVITTSPFTPEEFLQIVEKRKVTGAFTASYHLNLLLKSPMLHTTDLTKLNKLYFGGSKISYEVVKEMNEFLPNGEVFTGYGTSEVGGFISSNYPLPNHQSVGKLVRGSKMKVVGDDGRNLGIGENGEICIKPMNKPLGYYGNENATAEMFDIDGFVKTGDVGYVDDDGYIFLIDRKKDIFKYYSTHISPSEFEDVLADHPAIKSVCVVDVPDPEEMAPDLPTAIIEKSGNGDISTDEVHQIVNEHLPKDKRLVGGVYFTDNVPTTASDKIKRMEVRKIAKSLFDANHEQKR